MSNGTVRQLPRGWAETQLGMVVDVLDHRRVPVNADERAKRIGNVPYYGATGQVGLIDDFLFDEELVLLGEDGAPFLDQSKVKAYMIKGKAWVNNHAHVLRSRRGVLNSFLMYQLNHVDYRPFVSGTTRLKLPQGPMRQIPLVIAPEEEQRRIVAAIEEQFTRLDAAVAALARARANLKRYRAAVLAAACTGRLVPTEAALARAEGRDYETGDELLARMLQKSFQAWETRHPVRAQAEVRASQNGEGESECEEGNSKTASSVDTLPKGWSWATINQVTVNRDGRRVPVKAGDRAKRQGPYPYYGASGVIDSIDDYLFDGEFLLVAEDGANLLSRSTPIAFSAIGKFWVNNHAHVLEARPGMDRTFLESYLNSLDLRFIITGSAQPKLTQAALNRIPVPLPPLAEQHRIVAEIERRVSILDEMMAAVSADLKRAERLRQAVLRRAFAGQLVPQDPHDEPASALLERIKAERAGQAASTTRRGRRETSERARRRTPRAPSAVLPLFDAKEGS